MEEEDDDHICLACHSTIVGLDNYIMHRKTKCPGRKHKGINNSLAQTTAVQIAPVSFSLQDTIATTSHNSAMSTSQVQNQMVSDHHQQILTVQPDMIIQQPQAANTSQSPYTYVNIHDQLMKTPGLNTYITSTIAQHPVSQQQTVDDKSCVNGGFQLNSEDTSVQPHDSFTTGMAEVVAIEGELLTTQSVDVTHSDSLFVNSEHTHSFTEPTQSENVTSQAHAQEFAPSHFPLQESEFSTTTEIAPADSHVDSHQDDNEDEQMHCGITDFLSTLELQAKTRTDKSDIGEQESFEGKLKALKIANILNDLQFSSDSEGFPSDVDDLLEYADTDDELELMESSSRPHRLYTGGKWKPGMGSSNSMQTRGKHRPAGSKIATRHGKGKGKNYNKVLQAAKKSAEKNKAFGSNVEEEEALTKDSDEPNSSGGKRREHEMDYENMGSEESIPTQDEPASEYASPQKQTPDRAPHKCTICMMNFRKEPQLLAHLKSKGHRAKEKAKKKKVPTATLR